MAMIRFSNFPLIGALASVLLAGSVQAESYRPEAPVHYATETVFGLNIFYREAGDSAKPTLVLLHGFPASSQQYRDVLASPLAKDYHLIAPDYPGFGDSSFPAPDKFVYSFDHLAQITDK